LTAPRVTTDDGLLELAAVAAAVEGRLTELFASKQPAAASIDRTYGELMRELGQFTVHPGGKRLRPYLAYLAYAGYGGTNQPAIIDVAAALELYHTFLVIHDDVIDRDTMRHGRPNLIGRYRQKLAHLESAEARHYADSLAVLAGDMATGLMFELVAEADFTPAQNLVVIRRLTQSMLEIVGGEALDVLLPLEANQQLDPQRILQVMQYKTAGYSFAVPLQVGAMLAGAPETELAAIDSVATPLGVAFQITDDLLGMFGDERQTGKPVTSDLQEGKHTLLMAYGFELADATGQATLKRHLGRPDVSAADHAAVVAVLQNCGAAVRAKAEAAQYAATASRNLAGLSLSPAARRALSKLTTFIVERTK
jgi:geranylgeranyl diphosphate synthase type II